MRASVLLPLLLLAASCRGEGSSALPEARADEVPRAGAAADAVAVVELFTSEGCSSCPPADALLASLAADPRVLALSFHVDYWDELGWPDPFASPASTSRQRAYAASLGARGLYTPQLVVGGADAFVGSDRGRATAGVASALAHAPAVHVTLSVRADTEAALTIGTRADGAPDGSLALVALVQRAATSQVRAGENAGRTLHHVNVVRTFATRPLGGGSSRVSLELPRSLRRADAEVVAFVQAPYSSSGGMPVLGAARAPVPAAP